MPIIEGLPFFLRTNFCWLAGPGKPWVTRPKANTRSPIPDTRSRVPKPETRNPSPGCWHVVLRTIVRVIAGPAAKARRTFLRAAGGALEKVPNLPEHFHASSAPCIKKPPPKRGEVYPVRKPDNARASDYFSSTVNRSTSLSVRMHSIYSFSDSLQRRTVSQVSPFFM